MSVTLLALVFQTSSNLLYEVFEQETPAAQSLPPVSTSFQRGTSLIFAKYRKEEEHPTNNLENNIYC